MWGMLKKMDIETVGTTLEQINDIWLLPEEYQDWMYEDDAQEFVDNPLDGFLWAMRCDE